jgi:hypothetical protein
MGPLARCTSFAVAVGLTATQPASAGEPVPNRTLKLAGGAILGAGYAPVAVAAIPATLQIALGTASFVLIPDYSCFTTDRTPWNKPWDDEHCVGHAGGVQLLVPVAGPLLFAKNHPKDQWLNTDGRERSGGVNGLLIASASVQALGLAMIVAGFLFRSPEPVEPASPPLSPAESSAPKPYCFVLPDVARGIGLTLGVTRW